jgi:predicted aconitase
MYLTKEEEKMLSGEYGLAIQKAMQLLVAIGDIFEAEYLIDIESAQISGVSYNNIGDAGLEFLEEFSNLNAKVVVKSTLNPCGMDLDRWKEMGISKEYYEKQMRIIRAFERMGVEISCTCTPYFVGNIPKQGSHIAWSESSAVVFANSVLNARTNREGGPSALASAIIGKTPYYGLHKDENRLPNFLVKIETDLRTSLDFSLLGYTIGRLIPSSIPYIYGIKHYDIDKLKAISAALATSGGISMFHFKGKIRDKLERLSIDKKELEISKEMLSKNNEPDLICIGCPHCSYDEILYLAKAIKGKKLKKDYGLWIWTSKGVFQRANKYVKIIENAGCKIFRDTCMVVYPINLSGYKHMASNSCKAVSYVASVSGLKTSLIELSDVFSKFFE